jgi:hypothetical protein
MVQEHERAAGAWHAEWIVLPELCNLAHSALHATVQLMDGLQVNVARMQENLTLTAGSSSRRPSPTCWRRSSAASAHTRSLRSCVAARSTNGARCGTSSSVICRKRGCGRRPGSLQRCSARIATSRRRRRRARATISSIAIGRMGDMDERDRYASDMKHRRPVLGDGWGDRASQRRSSSDARPGARSGARSVQETIAERPEHSP